MPTPIGLQLRKKEKEHNWAKLHEDLMKAVLLPPAATPSSGSTARGSAGDTADRAAAWAEATLDEVKQGRPSATFPDPARPRAQKIAGPRPERGERFPKYHIENPPETMRWYTSALGCDGPPGLNCQHPWMHGVFPTQSCINSPTAWCAGRNVAGEYMVIELEAARVIAGVVIQGRQDVDLDHFDVEAQWVKKFRIQVSNNGQDFKNIEKTYGRDQGVVDFNGPLNHFEKFEVRFPRPILARYIRFIVLEWKNHISMRAGLLVCGDLQHEAGEKYKIGDVVIITLKGSEHDSSVGIVEKWDLYTDTYKVRVRRTGHLLTVKSANLMLQDHMLQDTAGDEIRAQIAEDAKELLQPVRIPLPKGCGLKYPKHTDVSEDQGEALHHYAAQSAEEEQDAHEAVQEGEERIQLEIYARGVCLGKVVLRRKRRILDVKRWICTSQRLHIEEQRLFLFGVRELFNEQSLLTLPKSEKPLELTLLRRTPKQVAWFRRIRKDPGSLLDAPIEMRSDKECVLVAFRQNQKLIDYFADDIAADHHFMQMICEQADGQALRIATPEVQADREVVLAAVTQNGLALGFAAEELCGDAEIVLAAVKENGAALRYASEELRSDPKIVYAAVNDVGISLRYAAVQLRADIDIVKAALGSDERALRYVDGSLMKVPRPPGETTEPQIFMGTSKGEDEELHLQITIQRSKGLIIDDLWGEPDPFCVCEVLEPDGKVRMKAVTPTEENTRNPKWNCSFMVYCAHGDSLNFEIADEDFFSTTVLAKYAMNYDQYYPWGHQGPVELEIPKDEDEGVGVAEFFFGAEESELPSLPGSEQEEKGGGVAEFFFGASSEPQKKVEPPTLNLMVEVKKGFVHDGGLLISHHHFDEFDETAVPSGDKQESRQSTPSPKKKGAGSARSSRSSRSGRSKSTSSLRSPLSGASVGSRSQKENPDTRTQRSQPRKGAASKVGSENPEQSPKSPQSHGSLGSGAQQEKQEERSRSSSQSRISKAGAAVITTAYARHRQITYPQEEHQRSSSQLSAASPTLSRSSRSSEKKSLGQGSGTVTSKDAQEGDLKDKAQRSSGSMRSKDSRQSRASSRKSGSRKSHVQEEDGKAMQEPLRKEFNVIIKKKADGELGLVMASGENDSTLLIQRIDEGPVQDWNTANPEFELRQGDVITEINGIRGNAQDMTQALAESDVLEMLVTPGSRADTDSADGIQKRFGKEFKVTITKGSAGKLGMGMTLGDESNLVVHRIDEGPVTEWNTANPDLELKEGDFIFEINGIHGNAQDLIKACKEEDILEMLVKRLRQGDSESERSNTVKFGKEFTVIIARNEDGNLGMDMVPRDEETLMIQRIDEGPVTAWNAANPDMQLKEGDVVVEINGVRGNAEDLSNACKEEEELKVVVKRPELDDSEAAASIAQKLGQEFEVTIAKSEDGDLGMEMIIGDKGTLVIQRISDGPVTIWNAANPDVQLKEGDEVVEINGIRDDAQKLIEACKQQDTLKMIVKRPEPDVSEAAATDIEGFMVTIARGKDGSLGMDMAIRDEETLVVQHVDDSPVTAWNVVYPGMELKEGDIIFEINGIQGSAEKMTEACKENATLKILVKRPTSKEFLVTIANDEGGSLGMDIVAADKATLVIQHIDEGPVTDWNAANPDRMLKEGDVIFEINGIQGSAQDLIDACEAEDTLELRIMRAEPDSSETAASLKGKHGKEFTVTLAKSEDDDLGMDTVVGEEQTLVIQHIIEGPVTIWNEANPDQELKEGDVIFEINGIHGSALDLIIACKTHKTLSMLVKRPEPDDSEAATSIKRRFGKEFAVSIAKSEDGSLGMDMVVEDEETLVIQSIDAGPVTVWNAANPDMELKVGDIVAGINGIQGNAEDLSKACKEAETLRMHVKRPEPDASSRGWLFGWMGGSKAAKSINRAFDKELLVTIAKSEDGNLGMDMVMRDEKTLLIQRIYESPVSAWNAKNSGSELKPGSVVLEINGIRGNAQAMAQACTGEEVLKLLVKRPGPDDAEEVASVEKKFEEFLVTIAKSENGKLGMGMGFGDDDTLVIQRIDEGPVTVWNATNPGWEVREGDIIAEVNGIRGNAKALTKACKKNKILKLLVKRLEPDASETAKRTAKYGKEFAVIITRQEDGNLGLETAFGAEETLVVQRIVEGPVTAWNAAHPDMELREGDVVVEINGIRGNAQDLDKACKEDETLKLVVKRLEEATPSKYGPEFMVTIEKGEDDKIGMAMVLGDEETLLIQRIHEGPITAWNSANPGMELKEGDVVAEVNGSRGSAQDMIKACKENKTLKIVVKSLLVEEVMSEHNANKRPRGLLAFLQDPIGYLRGKHKEKDRPFTPLVEVKQPTIEQKRWARKALKLKRKAEAHGVKVGGDNPPLICSLSDGGGGEEEVMNWEISSDEDCPIDDTNQEKLQAEAKRRADIINFHDWLREQRPRRRVETSWDDMDDLRGGETFQRIHRPNNPAPLFWQGENRRAKREKRFHFPEV